MTSPFEIQPVANEDIPILGEMLLRTKMTLTINRLLWKDWPNEAAQRPQYTAAVEDGLKDPDMENFKAVDRRSRKIVGYMVMARKQASDPSPGGDDDDGKPIPDPGADAEADAAANPLPDAINREIGDTVIATVGRVAEAWEKEERYELVFIVVDPAFRRQGIGSALLQRCFERARAAALPLAVCSEPAAYDFFAHRGFRDVTHADMDLAKWAPAYTGFGIFRLSGMVWRA